MGDIIHYLLLGVIFAVASALENMFWTRCRIGRGAAAGAADPLADPVVYICRLDRKQDREELADALLVRSRLLLDAFLAGDVSPLRQLMTPEVYAGLTEAAHQRIGTAATPAPEMRAAQIVDAVVSRDTATLRLALFAAGPGSAYDHGRDEAAPVATDIWTYERSTYRNRPEWLLVGTEPLS
jgi:predicted lipid-binding transport protein (Tim44 family)